MDELRSLARKRATRIACAGRSRRGWGADTPNSWRFWTEFDLGCGDAVFSPLMPAMGIRALQPKIAKDILMSLNTQAVGSAIRDNSRALTRDRVRRARLSRWFSLTTCKTGCRACGLFVRSSGCRRPSRSAMAGAAASLLAGWACTKKGDCSMSTQGRTHCTDGARSQNGSELVVVIYDAADDEFEPQQVGDHWPDTPRSRRILGEMARQANEIMAADPDPDSTFVAAVATCDPVDAIRPLVWPDDFVVARRSA